MSPVISQPVSATSKPGRTVLEDGATVAVVGGGPAGAFFALYLLRKARVSGRKLKVVIFERRRGASPRAASCPKDQWDGCNYCAGGISPRLHDVLRDLGLGIPEEIVQSRIHSITVQGFWKNIELEVPPGREMVSVYRGSRPAGRPDRPGSFDSFLLDQALAAGAELIGGEVLGVEHGGGDKPLVRYQSKGGEARLEADLVVLAAGVNEAIGLPAAHNRMLRSLRRMIPGFAPPRLRRALIFELEAQPAVPANLVGTVHFVEYGSKALPLEMCSLVPKRNYITVVLVGECVDAALRRGASREVIAAFLKLPHVRKLISPAIRLSSPCVCSPNMVVGSARQPYGDRVAAVGDLVTARLYKDGILSASQTAAALADTVLDRGVDTRSLAEGYGPTLQRFARNNRFASLVFLLHRIFFSTSWLSRVLYQAVISERKTTPVANRHLERILWRIASGDDEYRDIFLSMVHSATIWAVLTGGGLVTLRNYLTELIFGLRWAGFGRFTTGVALERLEGKRRQFARLVADAGISLPPGLEFERMYTIKVGASRARILEQLENFGETDRGYLRPRWVRIRRVAGEPHAPGCVIRYEIFNHHFCFNLMLEQVVGGHLAVYRVQDGFARGGVLIFEIEETGGGVCALSIYVAFDFARGWSRLSRPFWWGFRLLFPHFVHDVLWNHSLCQLKDLAEEIREADRPEPATAPLKPFHCELGFDPSLS